MKTRWIFATFICMSPAWAQASDFCLNSSKETLDQVISNKKQFLGKRVLVHAVLRTDGKEYTRLSLAEGSDVSILATADDESTAYRGRMSPPPPSYGLREDFFAKLKEREGNRFKPDMSKIGYYRQDVIACGRLVEEAGEYRFALDDMRVEKSYLLPFGLPGKARR